MKALSLDRINEGNAQCVLVKTNLFEYIRNLPENFEDYFIQRGIVTNRYLDNLWDTITKSRHIPSIVITIDGEIPRSDPGNNLTIANSYKILDGLQRTKKLKIIWDLYRFICDDLADDLAVKTAIIARKNSQQIKQIDGNNALFSQILAAHRENIDLEKLLSSNTIWLEVWVGLDQAEQIRKMLILNAGHKSVSIKHQIELLFIDYLELFRDELGDISISREKEISSISYSKKRTPGEFHFPHLISAFESLHAAAPVTTNADFSAERTFNNLPDEFVLEVDPEILRAFATALKCLDDGFNDELAAQWIGREVVISSLFGAIGWMADKEGIGLSRALILFSNRVSEFRRHAELEEFEEQRNRLQLSKVNIGAINRRAVFTATKAFLEDDEPEDIDWQTVFGNYVR